MKTSPENSVVGDDADANSNPTSRPDLALVAAGIYLLLLARGHVVHPSPTFKFGFEYIYSLTIGAIDALAPVALFLAAFWSGRLWTLVLPLIGTVNALTFVPDLSKCLGIGDYSLCNWTEVHATLRFTLVTYFSITVAGLLLHRYLASGLTKK